MCKTGDEFFGRRLLILSCSQRKRPSHDSLPAIERYNGPLFAVLRRYLRESSHQKLGLDIFILSAAYGLIPGDYPTPLYDQRMSKSRAQELEPQVTALFSDLLQDNYDSILFVLGKTYLRAFGNLHELKSDKAILEVAGGTIGKKQAQLKRWLWTYKPRVHPERKQDEDRGCKALDK